MPLVPCDSCRRHVRAVEASCPFCKSTRVPAVALAIAGTALLIAGCDAVSPAAKYGGPPAREPALLTVDASAEPTPEPSAAPAPSTSASSPRLSESANPPDDHVVAPVAKYGGPPRR